MDVREALVRAAGRAAGRLVVFCAAVASGGLAPAPVALAGTTPEVVPGELIVRFALDATGAEQADTLADRGGRLERTLFRRTKLVRLPRGASVPAAAAALERDPDVLSADPNYVRKLARVPNDLLFPQLWALDNTLDRDIDAPEAWDVATGSGGVVVGIVDSGLDYTHADLAPNVWTNPREVVDGADNDGNGYVDDVRGFDFGARDNAPLDSDGHGTHVAGTIGARGNNGVGVVGINWTVRLMPLRAENSSGFLTDAAVIEAFHYAGRMGARVVNGSFGGPGFSGALLNAINSYPHVLFVVAAGNGGADRTGDNNDRSPEYPCNFASANVICVAATGPGDALTDFSNFGAVSVDLAAPGSGILSTVPTSVVPVGYASGAGTSTAAPHVAGVAALAVAANAGLSTGQLRSALLGSVDPLPLLAGKVATGGRVNAFGAVRAALAPPPDVSSPPPPPPPPPPAPPPPPPAPVLSPPAPVDALAPNTRISAGPPRRTTARRATFRFNANEAGSTFQCRLDRGVWRSCRSPRTYRRLRVGLHAFRVRARDAAGNVDTTAALRRWRIR